MYVPFHFIWFPYGIIRLPERKFFIRYKYLLVLNSQSGVIKNLLNVYQSSGNQCLVSF